MAEQHHHHYYHHHLYYDAEGNVKQGDAPSSPTPQPQPQPQPTPPTEPKPPMTSGGNAVQSMTLGVRGQSNGYFLNEWGLTALMGRIIGDLTGLDVQVISTQNETNNTMHAGTSTWDWLHGAIGNRIVDQVGYAYSEAPHDANIPFVDVAFHWEDDLKKWENTYAEDYPTTHTIVRETIKDYVNPERPRGKYVTVLAHSPYQSGIQGRMIDRILSTWADYVQLDPHEFILLNNGLDAWHQDDWSHWTKEGAERVARRTAVRIARLCYDRGWSKNDLSHLPTDGPTIVAAEVDPMQVTSMVLRTKMDKGTKLLLNECDPHNFFFRHAGRQEHAHGIAIGADGTSIELTFPQPIPDAAMLYAFWHSNYLDGSVITDDWHLQPGAPARMLLSRTWTPLRVRHTRITDEPAPPPPTPTQPQTPAPSQPAKVDWSAIAKVVEDHYKKTGKWVAYEDIIRMQEKNKPTAPPTNTPPPPTPNTVNAVIAEFLAPLKVGINHEREQLFYSNHHAIREQVPFTHARAFLGWRPEGGFYASTAADRLPDIQTVRNFVGMFMHMQQAGYSRAFMDCTDILGHESISGDRKQMVYQTVRMVAEVVRDMAISPRFLAIGGANEWAVSVDDTMQMQDEIAHILREVLPQHIQTYGADGWKGWRNLVKDAYKPPVDKLSIADFHSYEANQPVDWDGIAMQLRNWAEKHSTRIVWGEAGPGWISRDETNYAVYPNNILNFMTPMREFAPMLWAVTNGSHWKLNWSNNELLNGQVYTNGRAPMLVDAIKEAIEAAW